MKEAQHDLIVIGAGPGGYVAAIRAAQLGLDVACVEKASELGGTCLRIGCIPSKALLEDSELYHEAATSYGQRGIKFSKVEVDLPSMMARKESVVQSLTSGIQSLFKKNKITHYTGEARIQEAGQVAVNGAKQSLTLKAPNIIIATGSQPGSLPGIEPDGEVIGSSTEALSYQKVPKHLVVIGAGYIGLELGSVWKRLGAQVTVLEYLDRILPGMDSELSRQAHKTFSQQGLEIHVGTRVTSAKKTDEGCRVECEGMDPVTCDRLLLAVGRKPSTANLGLEDIGIELENGRIPVNEHFATQVDGIYAIGDVVAGPMLAHKAEEEGIACAEWIARGGGHVNYDVIPGVVYTRPEIASVGQTEDQLKERAIPYRKGVAPYKGNGRAQTLGSVEGSVKMLAHGETDRLLGVHIIGARAGDLIAEAATAMSFGASSEDLALTCHAHPTLPEVIREAALATQGRAIHC